MSFYGAPPVGPDFKVWAEKFSAWLMRTRSFLTHRRDYDSAAEDGVILWDRENKYPVVSKDGAFVQIVLEDGQYAGAVTTDQTAASTNTAYALTYTSSIAEGVTNGTPASRLVFAEAGQYMISFSAQIASTSSSTVNFWFWPRINGTDVTGSTMKNALHQNNRQRQLRLRLLRLRQQLQLRGCTARGVKENKMCYKALRILEK